MGNESVPCFRTGRMPVPRWRVLSASETFFSSGGPLLGSFRPISRPQVVGELRVSKRGWADILGISAQGWAVIRFCSGNIIGISARRWAVIRFGALLDLLGSAFFKIGQDLFAIALESLAVPTPAHGRGHGCREEFDKSAPVHRDWRRLARPSRSSRRRTDWPRVAGRSRRWDRHTDLG